MKVKKYLGSYKGTPCQQLRNKSSFSRAYVLFCKLLLNFSETWVLSSEKKLFRLFRNQFVTLKNFFKDIISDLTKWYRLFNATFVVPRSLGVLKFLINVGV